MRHSESLCQRSLLFYRGTSKDIVLWAVTFKKSALFTLTLENAGQWFNDPVKYFSFSSSLIMVKYFTYLIDFEGEVIEG